MRNSRFLKIASVLGAVAVAMGAFGAHALRNMVDEKTLHSCNTGVQYHFYHMLGLLFVGLYQLQNPSKWVARAGWLFIAGICLFSGSLYTMTLCKAAGLDNMNWLGAITPFGGVCFIAGWLCLLPAIKISVNN
jgi:uncharacterized membrane protein YgdD (TMEM256/DUF423 family)